MEVVGEDLQVQVVALSHDAPNQALCLLNEDVAIATEVVTEKPEVVEIEKELVIQKRFIVKEKIMVPKETLTFPSNHSLGEHSSLFTEVHGSLVEVINHDSEESCKMEIASQESTVSRMDISSQESYFSQMECSSQEVDTVIKIVNDDGIQSQGSVDIRDATNKAKLLKEEDISINETKILAPKESSSETCLSHEYYSQIGDGDVQNGEEEVFEENLFQSEVFETISKAESGALKRKAGIVADDGKVLENERSLLAREEAVAARETACLSREKAITVREDTLGSQVSSILMAAANDNPSPKRLKLIGVFECN